MTTSAPLVRMANQMADFFRSQPDGDPVDGIADHIRKFWSPAMCRDALAHLRAGGEGFDPLAREAIEKLPRKTPDIASDATPTGAEGATMRPTEQ